jgi:hypothetical protein
MTSYAGLLASKHYQKTICKHKVHWESIYKGRPIGIHRPFVQEGHYYRASKKKEITRQNSFSFFSGTSVDTFFGGP